MTSPVAERDERLDELGAIARRVEDGVEDEHAERQPELDALQRARHQRCSSSMLYPGSASARQVSALTATR